MPTVYRNEGETKEEFAYRVQELIADDLDIIATCVSNKHKRAYTKNREFYYDFIDELESYEFKQPEPRNISTRPSKYINEAHYVIR